MKNGTCILIESLDDSLTESTVQKDDDGKRYTISGIFLQANILNNNKRIYPGQLMDREASKYIKEHIETHRAVGELNHPLEDMAINYERVSHKITSLRKDGDNWLGEAVITKNTPMGAIIAGLMDEGVRMGVSSRATGSLKLIEGKKIVQPDFRLITPADIVSDPSAPDAFVTNIMENKEWIFENGILVERDLEEIQSTINKLSKTNKLDDDALVRVFKHILDNKIGATR